MTTAATTTLSSKGQVVIPEEIRIQLGLETGAQFVVIADRDVVIFKLLEPPSQPFQAEGFRRVEPRRRLSLGGRLQLHQKSPSFTYGWLHNVTCRRHDLIQAAYIFSTSSAEWPLLARNGLSVNVTGNTRAKRSRNGTMSIEAAPSVRFFLVRW